ncbi:aminotransferase class IV [Maribacter halichondriae]|uniref:aminotransferase class IV n=1 Tax=Maribacter halichondriae TaxID=2980554 RepID=UPI00235813DA|nr:aminotransferase class IV [Maribacter sp. Hal144]
MTLYPSKVYLNGRIYDAEMAKISVFDRGFLFGDGIYEVMVQIGGRFFCEEAHLKRLDECLIKINIDFDISILSSAIPDLLEAADLLQEDCLLYIQVTRGVAPRTHAYPKNTSPTLMMYAVPKVLPDVNTIHASVVTMDDFRWSRCDIKMTSLLGNVMANERAMEQDCFETLFVRDGIVTEASHCNVFFVKQRIVYTHPANRYILDGVTRQIVLELCQELNLEVREAGISKERINQVDEAFLTGTSTQIASIRQIDNHVLYEHDEVGEVTKRLQWAFLEQKKKHGKRIHE